MKRSFRIQKFGNWDEQWGDFNDHTLQSNSPIISRYNNYGLMFEDLRTVIELNKTIEDILTEKYIFYKLLPFSKMLKRNQDVEDVKAEAETYNTLVIQSLFTTSLVTYAKWFTQSSGKKPKLEPVDVLKKGGKKNQLTHELVMVYRHQYFAHSGATPLEKNIPLYITDPRKPEEEHLFCIPQKKRLPTLTEVRSFHRLFMKVIEHIHAKMEKMKPNVIKVIKEEIEKKRILPKK